jgi:xylulokinase
MARLFLGLDSSTQSLSAIVIDLDSRKVVYEASLNFDRNFTGFGTNNGTLRNSDPLVVHSPPLLWAEALDAMFAKMQSDGVALGEILAVSGSGQQHGSVYLNSRAKAVLAKLNPARSLREQLKGCFARETSPIWMDSSTTIECAEIRQALGGIKATAQATGSDTFERFTGPQIRKFSKRQPNDYAQTTSIGLVSSFMASIVAGKIAPIDHGDGAGMNLMDIRKKHWHAKAVKATAPGLSAKLPPLAEPWHVIGKVGPYFTKKYGLNATALAVVWSGDNPCSVIGLGLREEGSIAISLGTSHTYFGCMRRCQTDDRGEGHVFGAPTGEYMTLICFKNGSLARERIRDMYSLDWDGFNRALESTKSGNKGALMLPWFEPEIVPRVIRPGLRRIKLDDRDAAGNCRAMVEAQMMSMRLHSGWMKVKPRHILATGGGSVNAPILQVMADVMNCPVYRIEISKSAALGAALRAAHAWLKHNRQPAKWPAIMAKFTDPVPGSEVKPNKKAVAVYNKLLKEFARVEQTALSEQLK